MLTMRCLAERTTAIAGEAKWYLFGSAGDGLFKASDVDVVVVCKTNNAADMIRGSVDVDQLARPIHLSILTESEEAEVCFVKKQGCIQIV
jgi:predicted nucleotidyltransferase